MSGNNRVLICNNKQIALQYYHWTIFWTPTLGTQTQKILHTEQIYSLHMGTEISVHSVISEKRYCFLPQLYCNKDNTEENSRAPEKEICLLIFFSTWITMLHSQDFWRNKLCVCLCVLSLSCLYVTWATNFFFFLKKGRERRQVLWKYSFSCSPPPFHLFSCIGSD